MVDFKKLSDRAKDLVDKRGGTDGLKRDAGQLKDIATGKGSLSDKAKAAAQALKEPTAGEAPAAGAGQADAKEKPAAKSAAKKKPAAKGGAKKKPAATGGAKKSGTRKAAGGTKKAAKKSS